MSAAMELQAALVAALRAGDGISGMVSGVFDGPPARATFPYAVIGEGLTFDWSHKTGRGREHRLAVTIWDEAGRAARLHALISAVEAAIEALPAALPHHRIVSLVLLRSRILRPAGGPWAGMTEYRARTLEQMED
jgi:hypothetical protein